MRVLAGFILLTLAACGQDIYGKAVSYSPLAPDPIEVTMPKGALFLSQQFSPRQLDVNYVHYGIDVWGRPGTRWRSTTEARLWKPPRWPGRQVGSRSRRT